MPVSCVTEIKWVEKKIDAAAAQALSQPGGCAVAAKRIIGGDFGQRQHHKAALVRPRVRQRERIAAVAAMGIINNIEIERTRGIAKAAFAPESGFDIVQRGQ